MKKRALALLLAALMLMSVLAGCGKEEETAKDPQKPAKEPAAVEEGKAYQATYLPIVSPDAEKISYINNLDVEAGKAWFTAQVSLGEEPVLDQLTGEPLTDDYTGEPIMREMTEYRAYSMDVETGKVSRLEAYSNTPLPEGHEGETYISNIEAMADGSVWIVERQNSYYFDIPEDVPASTGDLYQYYVDGGMRFYAKHFDASGKALEEVELQQNEDSQLGTIAILEDGTIFGYDWTNLYRYDATGAIAGTLPMENANTLFVDNQGRLMVSQYSEEGMTMVAVDGASMTLGEPVPMEQQAYMFYNGSGSYTYYYDMNGTIYGAAEGKEPARLMSWLDCDIDSANLNGQVVVAEDGTIYSLETIYTEIETKNNLVAVKLVDASTIPVKEELTLATVYMSWDVRSQIVDFNKSQDKVRITVVDYADAATEDNPNAGVQKLNTELLSGVMPDLFYLNDNIPVDVYAAKGFLMDLWPMIENDPELGRDSVMEHFFDTLSMDGKLYEITDRFSINTATGLNKVVGDGDSWNLQQLMETYKTLPEGATIFGDMDTKESVLETVVMRNLNSFIDWSTKQASFNSQEFQDLLTFVNSFPAVFDEEHYDWNTYKSPQSRILSGKQLLMPEYISSFDQIMTTNAAFQGGVSYIGYPTTDQNGSSFQYYDSFAIGSGCKNPEAAWSFIRQYLTEEHHQQQNMGPGVRPMMDGAMGASSPMMNMWYFPTNRKAFEASVRSYMTETFTEDPETGEQVPEPKAYYWPDDGGDGQPIYKMSQEEYDRFMKLYENTNTVSAYNEEIGNIIKEECEFLFAGKKDAAQTAQVIQDRVGLYIMEQG